MAKSSGMFRTSLWGGCALNLKRTKNACKQREPSGKRPQSGPLALSYANHCEEQRYRRAILSLIAKIRRGDEAEIRELYESIRKPNTLSEAVQEALDLKYGE